MSHGPNPSLTLTLDRTSGNRPGLRFPNKKDYGVSESYSTTSGRVPLFGVTDPTCHLCRRDGADHQESGKTRVVQSLSEITQTDYYALVPLP